MRFLNRPLIPDPGSRAVFSALSASLWLTLLCSPLAPQDSSSFKQRWRVGLSGRVNPTPAIGDFDPGAGFEVVSGAAGDGTRYMAVNAHGEDLWLYHTENSTASAPPAIGRDAVYGGSASGWMTHAIETNGKRRWRWEAPSHSLMHAPPAVSGDAVYHIDSAGTLYAVGLNGKRKWSTPATSDIAPAVIADDAGTDVIINTMAGVSRLRADGGKCVWTWGTSTSPVTTPAIAPVVQKCCRAGADKSASAITRVFAARGRELVCLNGRTGELLWRVALNAQAASSPAIGDIDGDGALDVVLGDASSVVCFDAATGRRRWEASAAGNAGVALADRRRGGRIEWGHLHGDAGRTGFYGATRGPLGVYATGGSKLTLIDGATGKILAAHTLPSRATSAPVVADLDGNGRLEVVLVSGSALLCLEDRAPGCTEVARAVAPKITPAPKDSGPVRNLLVLAQITHRGDWDPQLADHERMLEDLAARGEVAVARPRVPLALTSPRLHEYPFLYLTGHDDPALDEAEIAKLRTHLERGAFLFAESCCASREFDAGFRRLARKLFPKTPLASLRANHPIREGVTGARLESVTLDEREVLVYSPIDLGCSWGSGCDDGCVSLPQADARRLMVNLVRHAMGQ